MASGKLASGEVEPHMRIYPYDDYQDYVNAQTHFNKLKIDWVYVTRATVRAIAKDKKEASSIICHGTRSGAEQKYFKECFPDAYVIGTEISETASEFPMTVQHDFTKPEEDWVGQFDIVYSNSFDHSIKPLDTLETWRDQLTTNGRLYLEYAEKRSVCKRADPLMATEVEVRKLIAKAGLQTVKEFRSGKNDGLVFVCSDPNKKRLPYGLVLIDPEHGNTGTEENDARKK